MNSMDAKSVEKALISLADKEKAVQLLRFFKTGKGEYGEGDKFLGIVVPAQRKVVAQFRTLPLQEIGKLLGSPYHEFRLTALLILVYQFERCKDEAVREKMYDFYRTNRRYINNWDLVDLSARQVVGGWLLHRDRGILYQYAESQNVWDRRIAVIATFRFIAERDFADSLKLCRMLMADRHDLIHKATGWMLREIGKRDRKPLLEFLDRHSKKMPRTMLRYAIEHLSISERKKYMMR